MLRDGSSASAAVMPTSSSPPNENMITAIDITSPLTPFGKKPPSRQRFVTLASGQPAAVEVEKDGSKVGGTSIMGLMMLGAAKGDHVTISAEGEGAEATLAVLVELIENKFGEE